MPRVNVHERDADLICFVNLFDDPLRPDWHVG